MANNFSSNFTEKLARVFLDKFELKRNLTKGVNTQLLKGQYDANSGDTVSFRRPTDFLAIETSDGDLTSDSATDIIVGKATGDVQNYITTYVNYSEADQAIKMGNLDELLAPMATRAVNKLETNFAAYALKHAGLYGGTIAQPVATWSEAAEAMAVMQGVGVPEDDEWCLFVNPYTAKGLADAQRGLGAGGSAGELVTSAWERNKLSSNLAGMRVMTSTALASYTTGAGADRAGAVNGTMDVSYVTHKDTMLQTITVDGMDAALPIKAGDRITIAGVNLVNQATREPVLDASGASVPWVGVVAADVTMSTGAGNITVNNPAIYESGGAYNTVDAAIADNDVVTVLGSASTVYQPNLFWHKDAFSVGFLPMEKLYATDTIAETEDGLQLRVTRFSDGVTNTQKVRFDIRPAFASLNPYFAGHLWGVA